MTISQSPLKKRRFLVWIVLGTFLLASVIAWGYDLLVYETGFAWRFERLIGSPILGSTLLTIAEIAVKTTIWALAIRWVLKLRLREVAFRFHSGWLADFFFGIVLTTTVIVVPFAIGVKVGWLRIQDWELLGAPAEYILGMVYTSALSSISFAAVAELSMRAFFLNGLTLSYGKKAGLLILAGIVGLFWMLTSLPYVDLVRCLLAMLDVLIFGWIYLRRGSLWLPIGIHAAIHFLLFDTLIVYQNRLKWSVIDLFGISAEAPGPLPVMPIVNMIFLGAFTVTLLSLGIWLWIRFSRLVPSVQAPQQGE